MKYGFYKEEDRRFPRIVHVETTNVCNLKCIHCPQANDEFMKTMKPKMMEFKAFSKIAKEVGKNKGIFRMTSEGEPTIHPDWVKQVNEVLNSGVKIFCFNTNGNLLEGEKLEVLLQETDTLIAIEFSIDALYKDTYEIIRKGGDYSKLLSNIFTLIRRRNELKRENIKILVSCIQQPEISKDEFDEFVYFWSKIVDKVIIRPYSDSNGLSDRKQIINISDDNRWPCPFIFTRMVVGYDGEIRFCPCDWIKESSIGNINDNTIQEKWNSDFMIDLRKSHLNKNIKLKQCLKCTNWMLIKWGNDYIKALDDLFNYNK